MGASCLSIAAVAVACGTSNSDADLGTAGGAGSSGSGGSDSGTSGGGSDSDAYLPIDTGLGGGSAGDADTCSAVSQAAKRFPVDMYIMMDKSGSMSEPAAAQTRWQAVIAAVTSFLGDPSSTDMGVGIQFFPLPVSTSLPPCTKQTDCPPDTLCATNPVTKQGYCQSRCDPAGMCGSAGCVPTGSPSFPGFCSNDKCEFVSYSQPNVEIGTLPGNASAIIGAMQAENPMGGTPTHPALVGAIQHAQAWVAQHRDHKVVVVLATDGQPTSCPVVSTPQDEANTIEMCKQAASGALRGDPPIQTFVIGVGDLQANLDAIAVAGGTEHAFIVNASQDVAADFAKALAQIRGEVMTCDFKLPEPDGDAGDVDYGKVNVEYTPGSGAKQTIYYVESEAGCDPATGGWHYDKDPTQATPTRIIMCAKTCETLQADANAKVDIAIGCKSVTAPPK
jgi:hypothetical protein